MLAWKGLDAKMKCHIDYLREKFFREHQARFFILANYSGSSEAHWIGRARADESELLLRRGGI